MPDFRLIALPAEPFAPLFRLDDSELAARGMRRCTADAPRGYPCRVSLVDAVVDEEVLLLPFEHHATTSPYRSSGPIFVRRNAEQARLAVNEIPDGFRRKLLSIRAYAADGDLLAAEVAAGDALERQLSHFLATPEVALLHLHHARHGCYLCRVEPANAG